MKPLSASALRLSYQSFRTNVVVATGYRVLDLGENIGVPLHFAYPTHYTLAQTGLLVFMRKSYLQDLQPQQPELLRLEAEPTNSSLLASHQERYLSSGEQADVYSWGKFSAAPAVNREKSSH